MNMLINLLLAFAKIGLFTFGGGYAMLAMIEDNCVNRKKWITHDEMMNMTVVAESTPGPIAINLATYVGYKQAGLAGSIAATISIILPSFAIIFTISRFLDNFLEITLIANAFKGIKIAVGLLILNAGITMIKKMHKNLLPRAIMICGCAAMLAINIFSLKISSIALMIAAALVSLGIFFVKGGANK